MWNNTHKAVSNGHFFKKKQYGGRERERRRGNGEEERESDDDNGSGSGSKLSLSVHSDIIDNLFSLKNFSTINMHYI